jgi:hypothetical protein
MGQLDARSLADREAAEKALIGLGPVVLEFLPQDEKRYSAEVIERTSRIRQVLERRLAEQTISASTVTLHAADMPLSQVFAEIEKQTGNKIDARRLFGVPERSDPKLDVDFSEMPFWKALDDVLDRERLAVDLYGPGRAVTLRPRYESEAPRADRAQYSGPFRFEPVRVEAVRDLRNPDNRALRVALEISWEPRLQPVSLQHPRVSLEAYDENGNPIPAEGRQARPELPVMSEAIATELPIPLALPPREVQKIARLKGTLTVLVPGRVETFRFEELQDAKDIEKRIAAVTVTLERVRKNGDLWEIRVGVGFDRAGDALASHYNWILENEAHLESPAGEPINHVAMNTTRRTETEIGISYLFAVDGPLPGHVFVYKTPGAILAREFEFEVHDIELP